MNDGASNASGDSKTSEVRVRRKKVTVERVLSTGSFGFVWLCSFAPGVNVVVKFAPAADILARQHRSESGNRDTSPLATRSSAELHREALSLSLETAEIIVSAVESSPFLVNVVLDTSLERVRYNEAITNGKLCRMVTLQVALGLVALAESAALAAYCCSPAMAACPSLAGFLLMLSTLHFLASSFTPKRHH